MSSPHPATTGAPSSRQLVSLAERSLRLSVLIPVYNELHVAEASIRRVLALNDPIIRSLQVIVVDDCSSDGTSDVLARLAEEDDRILLIRHEVNQGKRRGRCTSPPLEHPRGHPLTQRESKGIHRQKTKGRTGKIQYN